MAKRDLKQLNPKRIVLFLHPNLGDAVHHTITSRWVHEAWPDARIVAVTGTLGEQILRGCPWIDEVWSAAGLRYRVLPRILAARFDLALMPYVHNPFARMVIAARIPVTVGIRGGKYDRFFTLSTRFELTENAICDAFEALLVLLGKSAGDYEPYIAHDPAAEEEADRLLAGGQGRLVTIMAGAGHANKCWPRERYAELAKRFLAEGLEVVAVGGPADAGLLGDVPGVLDLAGRCSVLGTAEVLRRSALAVTNDTGVSHLSSAVGTPTVVIYGPSRVLIPPGGPSVILRRECDCTGFEWDGCPNTCFLSHTVDKVFNASMGLLQPDESPEPVRVHR